MALTVTNNMNLWATGDTNENLDVGSGAGWYDLDNLNGDFGKLSLINSITADFYRGAGGVEGCIGTRAQSAATVVGMVYYDGSTTIDMSGTMFVRATVKFSETSKMGTKAQGGIRVIIMDSGGDYSEWYVGGKDDYSGDWEQYLIDVSTTPDNESTTSPTMTDINYIGISSYYPTAPARAENQYTDALWYGSDPTITVTGTVATAGEGWSELESISQGVTRRDGVIRLRNGIYEMRGGVKLGATATNSLTFSDYQNAKLRYPEAPVGSLDSISEILIQGNSGTTTSVTIGSLVSGAGLLGGTIFSTDVAFTVDGATDSADIDTFDLLGVSFEGAGVIKMDGTDQALTSCQLVGCGQFDPGDAVVRLTNFIATTDTGGAILWNDSIDIEGCSFIANTLGAGTEHATIESVYTGTADDPGSSTTVLYDAGATFTGGNVVVGEYIYNEDDGCYAEVISIDDANTITHGTLTGGTLDDWSNGDAYSISPLQGYDNLTFSGNTDDVLNSATGSDGLFISKVNGSNPATFDSGGSNVEFIGAVSIAITVLNNSTGLPIGTTCRVQVMLDSDKSVLMSAACNASGVASTTYSGSTPVDIVGWAREFNISNPDYVQKDFSGEVTSSGFALTLRLEPIV